MGQSATKQRPLRAVPQASASDLAYTENHTEAEVYDHWTVGEIPKTVRSHVHYVGCVCSPDVKTQQQAQDKQLGDVNRWLENDHWTRLKCGQSQLRHCRPFLLRLGQHSSIDLGVECANTAYGAGYICGSSMLTLAQVNEQYGIPDPVKAKEKDEEEKQLAALKKQAKNAIHAPPPSPPRWAFYQQHYPNPLEIGSTRQWCRMIQRGNGDTLESHFSVQDPPATGYYVVGDEFLATGHAWTSNKPLNL
jgi:hypothetical protein